MMIIHQAVLKPHQAHLQQQTTPEDTSTGLPLPDHPVVEVMVVVIMAVVIVVMVTAVDIVVVATAVVTVDHQHLPHTTVIEDLQGAQDPAVTTDVMVMMVPPDPQDLEVTKVKMGVTDMMGGMDAKVTPDVLEVTVQEAPGQQAPRAPLEARDFLDVTVHLERVALVRQDLPVTLVQPEHLVQAELAPQDPPDMAILAPLDLQVELQMVSQGLLA